jgi:predicted patatin/cPLA2 family phospholipase
MNTDVLDEAYNAGKNLAKERLAEIEDFLNVLEKK